MYELIVVACLIAQPARCEAFQLPFEQPMGMMQCMVQGQLHLVEWLADRPEWRVERWTCGLPKA